MEETKISLQEFWDRCNTFDWFYEMSDDHSVWMRGEKNYNQLVNLSHQSPQHEEMLAGFNRHYYSGEVFGKPKEDKPLRPNN